MKKSTFLIAFMLLCASLTVQAQTPDQSRGIDQRVDYASLMAFGPWDDRNYLIIQEELAELAPDEAELTDPIPAFFRIELRKKFPHLRRSGPAQYPRAAVPMFYRQYGGIFRDGEYIEKRKKYDEGEASKAQRGVVNGEIKLNQVLGANEVTIEINPANPMQVIAGSNNNGGQEMYYSTDGGANWTIQGTLPNTCCDPTVDWKSDGTVAYVAALSGPIGVSFWRSFDGGVTWQDRIDITPSGSDKEFIHVDRSPSSTCQDNVYVTYHNGNVMQFARSTNDGTSFDITAFPGAPVGIGSDITTTNNGDIYYFYGAVGNQTVTLLKSTDGGDSFATPITVTGTSGVFDWPIPAMESRNAWIYAAADADRSGGTFDGSVYVAFTDTTAPESGVAADNHTIIEVWYSRDGGSTWNVSNPHSMADTDTVDRFNQWIKVDEQGNVHVVFYDTRNSANRTGVDLYYSYSTDGAVTWVEPIRVSSETSQNLTDGQEWGDYNGLSIFAEKGISTWTDNRDGPPNSKDVYASQQDNPVASPTFTFMGDNLQQGVCAPDSLADINLTIESILGFTDSVTLSTVGEPAGFSTSFTVNPVSPPGASVAQISVADTVAAGPYGFDLMASSGSIDRTLGVDVDVFDEAPGVATLISPADGAMDLPAQPGLDWTDVPQTGLYTVEIDDDPGFGSIDFTAQVEDSEILVDTPLGSSATYYWRVRSANSCGTGSESAVFSFTTAPPPGDCDPEETPIELQSWDFEDGAQGWTHAALTGPDTWVLSAANPNSGAQHWHADDVPEISDQVLISPPVSIPSDLTRLTYQFQNYQEIEDRDVDSCWDGAILEVSTDGGANFVQVENSDLLTDPYDGTIDSGFGNPLGTLQGWCGDPQPYLNSIVDIDGLAGEANVVFRFRLATDSTVGRPGWDIDDVKILGCQSTNEDILFEHGYEDGDGSQ